MLTIFIKSAIIKLNKTPEEQTGLPKSKHNEKRK